MNYKRHKTYSYNTKHRENIKHRIYHDVNKKVYDEITLFIKNLIYRIKTKIKYMYIQIKNQLSNKV